METQAEYTVSTPDAARPWCCKECGLFLGIAHNGLLTLAANAEVACPGCGARRHWHQDAEDVPDFVRRWEATKAKQDADLAQVREEAHRDNG